MRLPLARVVAGGILALGACSQGYDPVPHVVAQGPVPTATTVPPTTTVTASQPHVVRARAARGRSELPARPVPEAAVGDCMAAVPVKTRAQSDACWTALVSRYPWHVPTALRILYCESRGYPGAVNRKSGAAGLFQIYPAQPGSLDPETNAAQAWAKYQARGWQPWVCR